MQVFQERQSYLAILGHFRAWKLKFKIFFNYGEGNIESQIFYVSRIVLIFVEGPVRSGKLMQDKVFSDKGGGKSNHLGKGGFLDKGEKAS